MRRRQAAWPWPTLKRDTYLTPGEVYRFDISLAPRQWGVRPGHRLRLELTSRSPADLCPDAGLPPANDTHPCGLTAPQQATVPGGIYTVHFGKTWPSTLNLPQLPANAFREVRSGPAPAPWNESFRRMSDPKLGDQVYTLPLDWGSAKQRQ